MGESERGCGWRKIGGVYLVCEGSAWACDGLPVELKPCDCCDFTVHQARSMQPIHAGYLASLMKGHACKDEFPSCPICFYGTDYHTIKTALADPEIMKLKESERVERGLVLPKTFYLMFVSKEFYTPESFMAEAATQGISKRVAPNSLPKGFRVGTDWVFLGHQNVRFYPKDEDGNILKAEPTTATGIFYAFKPQRLELVLWKGTDSQLIADYEEAGYTVVLIERTPENEERHGNAGLPPLPTGFKRKGKRKPNRSRDRGLYTEPKTPVASRACRRIRNAAETFRTLTDQQKELVKEHLSTCGSCREWATRNNVELGGD